VTQTRRAVLGLIGAASLCLPARAGAAKDGRLVSRPSPPTLPAPSPGTFIPLRGGAMLYVPKTFAPESPMPLLAMLHGAGGDALSTARDFAPAADARGMFVLAPKSHNATWDLHHMPESEDADTIDDALDQAFAHVAVARLALAGISDGASFALSLGLANGDLFGDVIAFSAGLFRIRARAGSPRIFISHGRNDRVLPFSGAERIAATLSAAGYDVAFHPFDGGHEVPPDVLNAALDRFLQ